MSRVSVMKPLIAVAPGFPAARLPTCVRRAEQLMDRMKARGEVVGSVEIKPDGTVRALTPAGLAALAADNGAWD